MVEHVCKRESEVGRLFVKIAIKGMFVDDEQEVVHVSLNKCAASY